MTRRHIGHLVKIGIVMALAYQTGVWLQPLFR